MSTDESKSWVIMLVTVATRMGIAKEGDVVEWLEARTRNLENPG